MITLKNELVVIKDKIFSEYLLFLFYFLFYLSVLLIFPLLFSQKDCLEIIKNLLIDEYNNEINITYLDAVAINLYKKFTYFAFFYVIIATLFFIIIKLKLDNIYIIKEINYLVILQQSFILLFCFMSVGFLMYILLFLFLDIEVVSTKYIIFKRIIILFGILSYIWIKNKYNFRAKEMEFIYHILSFYLPCLILAFFIDFSIIQFLVSILMLLMLPKKVLEFLTKIILLIKEYLIKNSNSVFFWVVAGALTMLLLNSLGLVNINEVSAASKIGPTIKEAASTANKVKHPTLSTESLNSPAANLFRRPIIFDNVNIWKLVKNKTISYSRFLEKAAGYGLGGWGIYATVKNTNSVKENTVVMQDQNIEELEKLKKEIKELKEKQKHMETDMINMTNLNMKANELTAKTAQVQSELNKEFINKEKELINKEKFLNEEKIRLENERNEILRQKRQNANRLGSTSASEQILSSTSDNSSITKALIITPKSDKTI